MTATFPEFMYTVREMNKAKEEALKCAAYVLNAGHYI